MPYTAFQLACDARFMIFSNVYSNEQRTHWFTFEWETKTCARSHFINLIIKRQKTAQIFYSAYTHTHTHTDRVLLLARYGYGLRTIDITSAHSLCFGFCGRFLHSSESKPKRCTFFILRLNKGLISDAVNVPKNQTKCHNFAFHKMCV